jgi:hypothetical protein
MCNYPMVYFYKKTLKKPIIVLNFKKQRKPVLYIINKSLCLFKNTTILALSDVFKHKVKFIIPVPLSHHLRGIYYKNARYL